MIKKPLQKAFVAAAAVGAVALGMGQAPNSAEARTLRFTTQLPAKNFHAKNNAAFIKCIEGQTDLKIEFYHSAQLYRDKEVPQAVSSGAIDMGASTTARFAGTIPAIEIFYVPFAMGTRDDIVAALAPGAKLRKLIDAAVLKTGARIIYWMDYGTAVFLSKKRKPIRTPADVKGQKVRVFGKTLGEFVKALGGIPTLTSGSEQFIAYQRGTVDAGMTGISSVKSRKLYQVMDVVTRTEHAKIEFITIINEKVWSSLSKKEQGAMMTCGRDAEAKLRASVAKVEEAAAKFTRDNGKEVVDLTKAQLAEWRKAGEPVIKAYLKNSGELGKKVLEAIAK